MSLCVDLVADVEVSKCDNCGHPTTQAECVFDSNITHELGAMADEAGIYNHLWRPEEIGITTAEQLIQPLEDGLQLMKSDPHRFKVYDAPNGWGTYEQFLPWVEEYLEACKQYPQARVSVSR